MCIVELMQIPCAVAWQRAQWRSRRAVLFVELFCRRCSGGRAPLSVLSRAEHSTGREEAAVLYGPIVWPPELKQPNSGSDGTAVLAWRGWEDGKRLWGSGMAWKPAKVTAGDRQDSCSATEHARVFLHYTHEHTRTFTQTHPHNNA